MRRLFEFVLAVGVVVGAFTFLFWPVETTGQVDLVEWDGPRFTVKFVDGRSVVFKGTANIDILPGSKYTFTSSRASHMLYDVRKDEE